MLKNVKNAQQLAKEAADNLSCSWMECWLATGWASAV